MLVVPRGVEPRTHGFSVLPTKVGMSYGTKAKTLQGF